MRTPEFIPKIKELESRVLPKIKPACGPLFFTTSLERAKGNVVDSGSFGLVYTGKKTLLVTCSHVWDDFLTKRERTPDLKLCTCLDAKNPICICTMLDGTKTRPIDQNRDLDIATFDMAPFRSVCDENKHFFIPNCGPQSQLKEQDPVAIIGYPGNLRLEGDDGILFGRVPYVGFASSISGYKIMVDFTRMMSLDRELTFKGDKRTFGGVSGGPCFVVRRDYEPYLIGFVTEHLSFSSVEDNFLQLTTSNCINEDGTIKPAGFFYTT